MAGLFNAEVTEKIRRGLCTFLEEGEELFEWIASQIFGKEVGDEITESEGDELGQLQRLLGRGVCDKGLGWNPYIPDPPFTGGQCAGVNYGIYVIADVPSASTQPSLINIALINVFRTGRILDIGVEDKPTDYVPFVVTDAGRTDITNFQKQFWGAPQIKSILVYRTDGLADHCGNPLPKLKNPQPPEIITDVEYDDENGIPQQITNTTFVLGNVNISPNGNVSIEFENSDLLLRGDVNIFPNYGVTYKNPISSPNRATDIFDPKGTGTEEPEPSLDESEDVVEVDDDDLPIIAVVVKSQKIPFAKYPYTDVPNGTAPTIVIPRIAWVAFKVKQGDTTAWMQSVDVKTVDSYVLCENPDGAIAYSIQWGNGWKGKAFAIQGKPLSEIKCCNEVT